MRRNPHIILSKGGDAIAEHLTRRTHKLFIGCLKRGRSIRKEMIQKIQGKTKPFENPVKLPKIIKRISEEKINCGIAITK